MRKHKFFSLLMIGSLLLLTILFGTAWLSQVSPEPSGSLSGQDNVLNNSEVQSTDPALSGLSPADPEAIKAAPARLPLSFEANQGQFDDRVRFVTRQAGGTFFFTPQEVAVVFTRGQKDQETRSLNDEETANTKLERFAFKTRFLNANPAPRIEGLDPLPGQTNYIRGNNPDEWQQGVPTYGSILYHSLYPLIDLRYYGCTALSLEGSEGQNCQPGQMKYDFILRPGADVETIALAYDGVDNLRVNEAGQLELETPWGLLIEEAPLAWQEINGRRIPVEAHYILLPSQPSSPASPSNIGFSLGPYNSAHPLIIDPILNYSTFVGGSGRDEGRALALDGAGNVVVTGQTDSSDFPTTTGAYTTTLSWGTDVFVLKLAADGGSLLFSTFVGGSDGDEGNAMALDGAGNVVVTGRTHSSDFPITVDAYDTSYNGDSDVFVLKLSADGGSLLFSTFVGGGDGDEGNAMALDEAGNVVVTGHTDSSNFPTTAGTYNTSHNGGVDVFVLKLAANGRSLLFSTFVGGSVWDIGYALALDGAGNPIVMGRTSSSNFPTNGDAYDTSFNGGIDIFILKLAVDGESLLFSTFVGGYGGDTGYALALDGAGNPIVTGYTGSSDFPTTAGAYDTSFNGGTDDVFVLKLAADGGTLLFGTFVGGNDVDFGEALVLDTVGNVVVTGWTGSSDFPTTAGAFDTSFTGGSEVFVLKLSADGGGILFSTFVGGSSSSYGDRGEALVLDGTGNVIVTGYTGSSDFPTTTGAYDTSFNSDVDVFVFSIPLSLFSVTDTVPVRNALAISRSQVISAAFSEALSNSTVNSSTFTVHGQQTGVYTGSYSFGSAHFDAANEFKPGEKVVVSLSSGIKNADGISLAPYAWQFRVAVEGGNGIYNLQQSLGGSSSFDVALADLDHDGDLDAFVANAGALDPGGGQSNRVWINNGGTFTGDSTIGHNLGNEASTGVALGDLNGDGYLDAFVVNWGQKDEVWLNDGGGMPGSFSHSSDTGHNLGDDAPGRAVALGDLNGDGHLDAFVVNEGEENTVWFNAGDGTGHFGLGQTLPGSAESWDVAIGDINGDGYLDAVVVNESQFNEVWLNSGPGQLSLKQSFGGNAPSRAVALADVDGDGDLDALEANGLGLGQPNKLWRNDNGTFNDSGQSLGNANSWAVAVADVDADNDLDVIFGNLATNKLWLNNGGVQGGTLGTFSDSGQSLGNSISFGLDLGDVDGSGRLAIVAANGNNDANTVWLNGVRVPGGSQSVYLPLILKPDPNAVTTIYVRSINTGGATVVIYNLSDTELLRCTIGDNTTQLCGTIASIGTYKVTATARCGSLGPAIFDDANGGNVTRSVYCN